MEEFVLCHERGYYTILGKGHHSVLGKNVCSHLVVEDKFPINRQPCEVPPNDIFACRDDRIEGAYRIGDCIRLQVRAAGSALAL